MPKQEFLRNRRLRVFGGPNGSGKSTILNLIGSQYDIGYYINADEIEKELKNTHKLTLSEFGIREYSRETFIKEIQNHSLINKAKKEGYVIDLILKKNAILNPNRKSHSYEAAFLAVLIRKKLLQ